MIIRIVKLTLSSEKINSFIELFKQVEHEIKRFDGCENVILLQDINQKNILFTYSYWQSEEYLNAYRNSELFISTWKKTKQLFSEKAEAWSVSQL